MWPSVPWSGCEDSVGLDSMISQAFPSLTDAAGFFLHFFL